MNPSRLFPFTALLTLLLVSAGCAVGPHYKRPTAAVPPAFKEQPPVNFKEAEAAGWKQSQPGDAYSKGRWWELYNDAALNALEEQVGVSNQNVLEAEAQYRQARAAVSVARAAVLPVVTADPAAAVGGPGDRKSFSLPFNVAWEPDLWGNIRRGVTASAATAQSLAASVGNARLLYQAELAQDYFGLHGNDTEAELLTRTEASYKEYLTLTQNRFSAGIASDLDVAQAETQLYFVQSQLMDLGVERAALEHGIAILTGKAPAELGIPPVTLTAAPPPVPLGVPSELLERRPDIAAAERQVAAANEQIGIAIAAFYPTLTLSATGGVQSSALKNLLDWPSRFWSVGPSISETVYDGGLRRATVNQYIATYNANVAAYRQSVLVAFEQVEDSLAAVRILSQQILRQQEAVNSSQTFLRLESTRYESGIDPYIDVVTAQTTLLSNRQMLTNMQVQEMTASIQLIEALGGGWDRSQLPTPVQITQLPTKSETAIQH